MSTAASNPGLEFMRARYGIDAALAQSLLDAALSKGGDYAELYFEHRTSSAIVFEQQAVKSANRAINQGLGVRVLLGEAVGYAYTEDLSRDAMLRAAETAANIASHGAKAPPIDVVSYETAHSYSPAANTLAVPSQDKVELLRRADEAARAYDGSIARVDLSFNDELKYVAIFTSDGRMTGDVQPLVRFGVSCLSERGSDRQTARWGGGGRMGMAYFDQHSPEDLAREAARQAVLLQSAVEAPAGT
ncbi:MAG TPA: DNA gyrase modulator, partial [Dehalococcoidia bacterium]